MYNENNTSQQRFFSTDVGLNDLFFKSNNTRSLQKVYTKDNWLWADL